MEKMNKVLVHLYLKIIVMFVFLSLKKVCSFFFLHKSFDFFRAVHGIMAELHVLHATRGETAAAIPAPETRRPRWQRQISMDRMG